MFNGNDHGPGGASAPAPTTANTAKAPHPNGSTSPGAQMTPTHPSDSAPPAPAKQGT
jgi:hypothetical protein